MKSFVMVSLAVLLLAPAAFADAPGGTFGVYTVSNGGGECVLHEQLMGINTVYVVHRTGPPAQGVVLKVSNTWSATVLNILYPVIYIVNPDIFGGDLLSYNGCQTPPYSMARIDFFPMTPTPPCTAELRVEAAPDTPSGEIEAVDCSGSPVIAQADYQWLIINYDGTCECHVDPPVSTDEATWSRIKALYR